MRSDLVVLTAAKDLHRTQEVLRSLRFLRTTVLLVTLAGCEGQEVTLPVTKSQVVIHSVMTGTGAPRVLVERTLTGATPVRVIPWEGVDPLNVLGTDGGIPVNDAVVELTLPGGQVLTAIERTKIPGTTIPRGDGMYDFLPAPPPLMPGTYQLKVTTPQGEVLVSTAELLSATTPPAGPLVTFDRANDTLTVSWAAVPEARGYQVRFESPYGPWTTFTDKTTLKVNGSLRNIFAARFPSVFMPGYRQTVSVSAVDSNVYDYYRSSNNGFTGAGIINRVQGGLGVFGSMITVARRQVEVTAPYREPIEGEFQLISGPQGYPYGGFANASTIKVYIEAPATRSGQLAAVSFGYHFPNGAFAGGSVGTWSGTQLKLYFIGGSLVAGDTVDRYTAELRGDTIKGTFFKGAPAYYVRIPSRPMF